MWKLLAFVARYGHTPPGLARRMSVVDLGRFANELAQLLLDEDSRKNPFDF